MSMSSVRFLPLLLMLISYHGVTCHAQSTFIDPRDGQSYEIVKIGSFRIFNENLRYVSPDSYAATLKYAKKCKDGNFYSITEVDSVCPVGTHLMTDQELGIVHSTVATSQGVNYKDFEISRDSKTGYFSVDDKTGKLDLFHSELIDLQPNGWVQGKRIKNRKTLSLWVLDFQDPRAHAHIGATGYMKHEHDHHVIDESHRVRKFQVRCTLDDNTPIMVE